MPKRKFINKKNAVTFQVVHRSQKDPLIADETAPKHVLVPIGGKKPDKSKQDELDSVFDQKEEQIKYGIYYDDDYNYLQHLKTIGDPSQIEWAPVASKRDIAKPAAKKEDLGDIKLKLPSSVFESGVEERIGLLNKAAPHSGPRLDFDPDVIAAMDEDFDYNNEENILQDDFMKLANSAEPLMLDEDEVNDADWEDYDSEEGTIKDDGDSDRFPFEDDEDPFKEEETKSRFTQYSMTSSVVRRNNMLTLLDDRFEKIYEQYDDTELGALDTEEIEGHLSLSDNRLLALAEEFEKQLEEDKLIGDNMITLPKDDVVVAELSSSGELVDEEEEDSDPFATSSEDEEQFDCVSILTQTPRSEYMPTVIELPKANKPQKIKISSKTGIPLDVLGKRGLTKANLAELDRFNKSTEDDRNSFEDETESVLSTLSILSLRAKNESPEERRARKHALKEYRRERRTEKKANTLAFKEEKKRQDKVSRNMKVSSGLRIV